MYNSKVESVKKYECDYCFAGNYWDDRERDLVNSLVQRIFHMTLIYMVTGGIKPNLNHSIRREYPI